MGLTKIYSRVFENEFDIEIPNDLFEASDPVYPESISTDYVAGVFDANGMVSLIINEQPVNNTGYGISLTARITISHPNIRVKPNLIRYFQRHGLEPGISTREDRLEIRFDSVGAVEKFIGDNRRVQSTCTISVNYSTHSLFRHIRTNITLLSTGS